MMKDNHHHYYRNTARLRIGDPLDESTLMGPLVNAKAVDDMFAALETVKEQGGDDALS